MIKLVLMAKSFVNSRANTDGGTTIALGRSLNTLASAVLLGLVLLEAVLRPEPPAPKRTAVERADHGFPAAGHVGA